MTIGGILFFLALVGTEDSVVSVSESLSESTEK
jgi:hypothetical protein